MPASKKNGKTETISETDSLDLSALDNASDIVIREVADVPERVKAFVEDAYTTWQSAPEKYRTVTLGTEDATKQLLKLMRKYAKTRQPALTIRTRDIGDPARLVFRATDKQTRTSTK